SSSRRIASALNVKPRSSSSARSAMSWASGERGAAVVSDVHGGHTFLVVRAARQRRASKFLGAPPAFGPGDFEHDARREVTYLRQFVQHDAGGLLGREVITYKHDRAALGIGRLRPRVWLRHARPAQIVGPKVEQELSRSVIGHRFSPINCFNE